MHGLEAIAFNKGWEIAFLGVLIVFSGLVFLSLAISQLYKLLDLWDKRMDVFYFIKDKIRSLEVKHPVSKDSFGRSVTKYQPPPGTVASRPVPPHVIENLKLYKMLSETISSVELFLLPRLLKVAKKRGLARPHSTINELIQERLLIPDGEGYFQWSYRALNHLTKLR